MAEIRATRHRSGSCVNQKPEGDATRVFLENSIIPFGWYSKKKRRDTFAISGVLVGPAPAVHGNSSERGVGVGNPMGEPQQAVWSCSGASFFRRPTQKDQPEFGALLPG